MSWLGIALAVLVAALPARAQRGSMDFGLMYSQQQTKFVGPKSANTFYLRGASVDLSYGVWKGLGVVGSGTGLAATNLFGNIDIHQVEFVGGLRYTHNFGHITPAAYGRKAGVFVEAKGGYTIAMQGLFPVNGVVMPNASALTYEGGGGFNFHIYQRFDVRLVQAEYVVTQLPNGGTNQQAAVRLSSGVNFHFGQ
jgi:hypothetical protein